VTDTTRKLLFAAIAAILIVVLVAAIVWLAVRMAGLGITEDIKLPLLAIAGVLAFLVALGLVAASFASLGLTDPTEALALPPGSVRAVIALCLVTLFGVISVALYTSLAEGPLRTIENITPDQWRSLDRDTSVIHIVASLPLTRPIARDISKLDTLSYTVWYRQQPTRAGEQFASQLLAVIGTLVTAVASFYFGAKTAASPAAPAPAGARPTLRGVTPDSFAAGSPEDLTLSGGDLLQVTAVELNQGSTTLQATDVTSSETSVKCTVSAPAGSAGKWDVVAKDAAGRTARLPAAVKVS